MQPSDSNQAGWFYIYTVLSIIGHDNMIAYTNVKCHHVITIAAIDTSSASWIEEHTRSAS
jgi:hypothetical protein